MGGPAWAAAWLLGLAASTIAPATVAAAAPPPAGCTRLGIIGDSLTVNSGPELVADLQAAGLVDFAVDAVRGRRWELDSPTRGSGRRALRAMLATGYHPDCYVIAVGTNDVGQVPTGDDARLIAAALDELGDVPVLWVNVFRPPVTPRDTAFDAALEAATETHPKLMVADFAALAAPHPEWLAPDHYHLRKNGSTARATWLTDQIVRRLYGGSVPVSAQTCRVTRKLRVGSKGDDVLCLEQRLASYGLTLAGPPDRRFDVATARALARFQTWHLIPPSGTLGPRTAVALGLAP